MSLSAVHNDPLLYGHLLALLVGTLLYGFLSRELLRQPSALPGWSSRALTLSLTAFFALSLAVSLGPLLLGDATRGALRASRVKSVLDFARASCWLVSWPLLVHTCRALPAFDPGHPASGSSSRTPSPLWPILAWIPLFPLVVPTLAILDRNGRSMSEQAWSLYPLLLTHAAAASLLAGTLLARVRRLTPDPELRIFARSLLWTLVLTVALLAAGGIVRSALSPRWADSLWALGLELSGLLLGACFVYFVQRYNLLRLSLSMRSLRHFTLVIGLVLLTMLIGAFGGVADTESFRRFAALGILAALAAAILWSPLAEWADLHPRFRALFEKRITPAEVESVASRIRTLDGTEETLRTLTVQEIGRWLDTEARFLRADVDAGYDSTQEAPWLPRLRDHFAENPRGFNRLDAPSPELAAALLHGGLHAVLPLRIGNRTEWLLGLFASRGGGGYQEAEMRAVELLLGQLSTTIEMRRLTEERLASERALADRERLGALGQVSAALAHELKNPLSAMKSLAQTVQEELERERPGGERAEDLGLIVDQIDRLDEVAREVLAFAGPAPLDPDLDGTERVDLSTLLQRTLRVLDHEAKRRAIELDRSALTSGVSAPGKASSWQTATLNLVLNAIEHAPAGSTVSIGLRPSDDPSTGVEFWTENAGDPIEPDLARRLFEPFVGNRRPGSTGLGLALVRQRAAELGGELTLENRDQAIRFTLHVPAPHTRGVGPEATR